MQLTRAQQQPAPQVQMAAVAKTKPATRVVDNLAYEGTIRK